MSSSNDGHINHVPIIWQKLEYFGRILIGLGKYTYAKKTLTCCNKSEQNTQVFAYSRFYVVLCDTEAHPSLKAIHNSDALHFLGDVYAPRPC